MYAMCKRNDLLDFFTPGLPTEGDRSTVASDLSARKVTAADSNHYHLEGDVRLQQLDALLQSDFLDYATDTSIYNAYGHVRAQDRGMLMSADSAHGTGTPHTTVLENVHYQLLNSRGNGTGTTANMTDPDYGTMTDGTFSTCDPDDRRWYLRGREMEMDKVLNKGYAHDVTLYYDDIPFFWFPYASFPLNEDRASGFLYPHVSYNSRRGLVLGAPYYFDLAPNYDATLDPRISTERGPMLNGQFRYLDATDKAQIDFTYVPHDGQVSTELAQYAAAPPLPVDLYGPESPLDLSPQRYALRIRDANVLSDNWVVVVNVDRVSDKAYLQDFGDSLTTSATALLSSSAYLMGRGLWWTASFGADSAQLTQASISDAFEPYQRLPRATFQGEHSLLGDLVWGINSEYVDFQRSAYQIATLPETTPATYRQVESVEGQRLDAYPYLAYPIETAGYFIRPELGVRYTAYDLDNIASYTATNPGAPQYLNRTPSRSVPIFDLDAGLIFDRSLHFFGDDFTQTLEPRLYYLRVPYRNQDDLPIFDTQLPSFDFPSLFRSNSFVGADRQSNANNLTLAVTSRLIDDASGDQLLSASFGQIRYFEPQRVQLPGYPQIIDESGSDYVAEVDLRLNDRWELKWDQQYNPNPQTLDPTTLQLITDVDHTDLSSIELEHRFDGDGVINFAYRFRRGLLEQIDTTALLPLNERWSLVGRYYYSLMDKTLLETFAGAEYDSCCVALRVVARRYINAIGEVHPSTGLYVELEFKGLGNTGTRTGDFLRRAILGYE